MPHLQVPLYNYLQLEEKLDKSDVLQQSISYQKIKLYHLRDKSFSLLPSIGSPQACRSTQFHFPLFEDLFHGRQVLTSLFQIQIGEHRQYAFHERALLASLNK